MLLAMSREASGVIGNVTGSLKCYWQFNGKPHPLLHSVTLFSITTMGHKVTGRFSHYFIWKVTEPAITFDSGK